MIRFTVYGTPQPAGSKIAGVAKTGRRFVRDDNPKAADWKRAVADAAGRAMAEAGLGPLDGPLYVEARFMRPRPPTHYRKDGRTLNATGLRLLGPTMRPDVLKLMRAVEDGCNGVVWHDDSQIVSERIAKVYADGPTRVDVTVRTIVADEPV